MKGADYFRIEPQFWTGRTGKGIRSLGLEARVVATYLLTGSTASALGLYYLPLPLMVHETGIPFEGALKALRSLEGVGFAFYDHDAETVWVPEMARIQVAPSLAPTDNRVKWVQGEAIRISRLPFFAEFLARYGDAFHLEMPDPVPFRTPRPQPDQPPNGRPFEAPSKPTAPATAPARTIQGAGRPATATDDQVRATFEAICRGLSLPLTYGHEYVLGVERVMAKRPKDLAEVEAVAAHYRKGLEAPARPSFPRFCEKYDERRAQWKDANVPTSSRKREPNRARPTSVPGNLYCEVHGLGYQATAGCKVCAAERGDG